MVAGAIVDRGLGTAPRSDRPDADHQRHALVPQSRWHTNSSASARKPGRNLESQAILSVQQAPIGKFVTRHSETETSLRAL